MILRVELKELSPGESDAIFCTTTCNSERNEMKLLLPQRGSLKRPSKAATLIGTEIYLWGLARAFLQNAKDCGRAKIKGKRNCG